ncbi:MBOAT family O-acyltransferase [Rhizorhabdus dicambivorans]|uniref:Probable alginate O-acetylase AlgI n=1 Tax=Rhizorhabdus dicambivorans TaxID=1850238 RepID=A0A2A4FRI5_9SPHN|nr:MBOAT family protein [Rhizorhabdus dicambivorans]ATE64609.1 MBOAT family protein [Rhizorhabdus dicambivorans]PCE40729.1 MBOAT family protein [Rhizorhabdus dicambivorans]
MLFTSIDFLFFFAALLALLAIVRNSRARFWIVLAASYLFYAAWDWRLLSLLVACSLWNWALGLVIEDAPTQSRRKAAMIIAVALNLLALGFFKYADFFVSSFETLFNIQSTGALGIILPLGISFFTFQGISYVVDIYRGTKKATRDLVIFLFFKAFFPQLIAGPIVRAPEFMPQLARPFRMNRPMMLLGAQYFLVGAVSKLVLADNLAYAADWIFADPAKYDTATLWLGLLSYTGQIYCDFFGYSMMAIGLARIMGYRLPINFRMPYVSLDIQEFWRRWHITLSNWLRDYLYIALGGNRKGAVRTYANLGMTMLIGGLWHGASWSFVLWGGLHGGALIVNRLWSRHVPREKRMPPPLAWAVTFLFVTLVWVPFRAPQWETTTTYFRGLAGLGDGTASWPYVPAIIVIAIIAGWHIGYRLAPRWRRSLAGFRHPGRFWQMGALLAAVLSIILFTPLSGTGPFIYFQF